MPRTRDERLALLLTILLATFGGIWVVYGIAVMDLPRTPLPSLGRIPPATLGWAWITTGAWTMVVMLAPRVVRWIAYPAAVFMPLVWTVAFAFAWVKWHVPFAWEGTAIWAGFTVAVVVAAFAERLTGVRA